MKYVFIALFLLGCLFANAGYGADDPKQKRTYWIICAAL
jgi:hypothetical protein